jgi:hypothetical protein
MQLSHSSGQEIVLARTAATLLTFEVARELPPDCSELVESQALWPGGADPID